MCKWHALLEDGKTFNRYDFYDLTDEGLVDILKKASINNPNAYAKVWCEKGPDDVAHIGAMDIDPTVDLDSIIEEVKS